MSPSKKEFSQSVTTNICRLSRLLFNANSDENLLIIFRLDKSAIELTIQKIVDHFPNDYFNSLSANQLREMESILAKEFIFFQVQEKDNEKKYQNHLLHFSEVFVRDMQKRFKVNHKSPDKMKEE